MTWRICMRMRAHFVFLILVFLTFIENGIAIKCYKCAVYPEANYVGNTKIVTPMCSKFDESDQYIVDCPFSTMCLKTISTLQMQNGQSQETIIRGCAQQKDTTQVFRDRQWHQEHSVQEVYEEGCDEFKENNLAGSAKTHCYCRGKLCNSEPHHKVSRYLQLKAFTVILSFNVLHWLKL